MDNDNRKMRIKLYSLQRSGSTYLEWILENDFDVEIVKEQEAGWKHALPEERYTTNEMNSDLGAVIRDVIIKNNIAPLIIYKDYEHWLESIERRPIGYHNMQRPDPKKFYWKFYWRWSLMTDKFIKYEDFIKDFIGTMDKLGKMIGSKPIKYEEPKKIWNSPEWTEKDKLRYM